MSELEGSTNITEVKSKAADVTNKKPILFVVDAYFPMLGGAEMQALLLAKGLRQRGEKVEFIVPHLDEKYPLDDQLDGFSITRIPYPKIKVIGALVLMFRFACVLLQRRKKYSFIHVHITKLLATTLGFIRPWLGTPVITKISGYAEFTGGVLDTEGKRFFINHLMVRCLRRLDYIHTISDYTRARLHKVGFNNQQIMFIPNAVETEYYSASQENNKTEKYMTLGFCGRLRKIKGINVLLTAISLLPESKYSQIRLLIAGDGFEKGALEKQCEELGLSQYVDFCGEIKNVPEFMQQLDIYVQPSFAEGLPNAVLEAMSSSLPIIASRVSGNIDLVEPSHNGMLFEAGDEVGLSEILSNVLDDRDSFALMGQHSRAIIDSTYSLDIVCKKFIELYHHG